MRATLTWANSDGDWLDSVRGTFLRYFTGTIFKGFKHMRRAIFFTIPICAMIGCMQGAGTSGAGSSDACGASKYQALVGGPSSATLGLDIPDSSRHYGSEERTANNNVSRLNFVHSGTAFESITDPNSTVIRVFCG